MEICGQFTEIQCKKDYCFTEMAIILSEITSNIILIIRIPFYLFHVNCHKLAINYQKK